MGADIKGIPALNEVCLVGRKISASAASQNLFYIENSDGFMSFQVYTTSKNGYLEVGGTTGAARVKLSSNPNTNFIQFGCLVGTNAAADASTMLQVVSTTSGIGVPQMTGAQRAAIGSPIEGDLVYDTTAHKLYVKGTAGWEAITSI